MTNPPRLSVLAISKATESVFLFADDVNVADACAHQFYADALARLQTLDESAGIGLPDDETNDRLSGVPYRVVSFVSRAQACSPDTESVVDLMDLEGNIMGMCDPSTCAIFSPEEYPALVWLDLKAGADLGPDLMTDVGSSIDCDIKTLVFPSGAIVVNGTNLERMEDSIRRKLPLIHKCMRGIPESAQVLFSNRSSS